MGQSLIVHGIVASVLLAGCQSRIVHHETACSFTPSPTHTEAEGQPEQAPPGILITEMSARSPRSLDRTTDSSEDKRTWSERHPFLATVGSATGSVVICTTVVVVVVGLAVLYGAAASQSGYQR